MTLDVKQSECSEKNIFKTLKDASKCFKVDMLFSCSSFRESHTIVFIVFYNTETIKTL